MSVYGYDQAISQGSAFNNREEEFNDRVRAANSLATEKYNTAVKSQKKNVSDDKTKSREDQALYGVEDGKGALTTLVGTGTTLKGIATKGLGQFSKDEISNRGASIQTVFENIRKGGSAKEPSVLSDDAGDASGGRAAPASAATAMSDAEKEAATKKSVLGEGSEADETWNESSQADRDLLVKNKFPEGAAASAPEPPAGVGQAAATGAGDVGSAGAEVEGAGAAAFKEQESSGVGTTILKTTLEKIGVGKVFGDASTVAGAKAADAGLTAVSEVAGKAAGEVGGFIDIGEGFDNLENNKSFFAGQTTGDKWQEAGAVTDLVGTVFPPLELLGGAMSLIGGIMDAKDAIVADSKKKKDDAAPVTAPTPQKIQVSPAFSSLGLIASRPISAKSAILGSSSF
jgi:hypothetical protein